MMDPYRILNIPPGSPPDVVENAFRVAAQRFHPNNGGSKEQFAQIVAAYNSLKTLGPAPVQTHGHQQSATQTLTSGATGAKYALPPRIHGTPATNRTPTLPFRLLLAAALGALAFVSSFAFNGFSVSTVVIVTAAAAVALGVATAPQALVASHVPRCRQLLFVCAAGVALWPLIVGILVTASSSAAIFITLKKRHLL